MLQWNLEIHQGIVTRITAHQPWTVGSRVWWRCADVSEGWRGLRVCGKNHKSSIDRVIINYNSWEYALSLYHGLACFFLGSDSPIVHNGQMPLHHLRKGKVRYPKQLCLPNWRATQKHVKENLTCGCAKQDSRYSTDIWKHVQANCQCLVVYYFWCFGLGGLQLLLVELPSCSGFLG